MSRPGTSFIADTVGRQQHYFRDTLGPGDSRNGLLTPAGVGTGGNFRPEELEIGQMNGPSNARTR